MAWEGSGVTIKADELWSQRPLGLDSALQDLGKKMIRTAVLTELNMVVDVRSTEQAVMLVAVLWVGVSIDVCDMCDVFDMGVQSVVTVHVIYMT